MSKKPLLFFASILLAGCVPYVTTYPKIQAPNASYLHPGCQAELSPNSMVYYPFHGIYISIDGSRFGLHIPSATVVELNGKTIEIAGVIGTTPYRTTLNLRAAAMAATCSGTCTSSRWHVR